MDKKAVAIKLAKGAAKVIGAAVGTTHRKYKESRTDDADFMKGGHFDLLTNIVHKALNDPLNAGDLMRIKKLKEAHGDLADYIDSELKEAIAHRKKQNK